MSEPGVALDLQIQSPFDGTALRGWLTVRAVPGVEEVAGPRYRRVLRVPDGLATLDLEFGRDRVAARLSGGGGPDARAAAVRAARALVDADGNPAAVLAVLGHDPHLGPLVRANPGLRCPGTATPPNWPSARSSVSRCPSSPRARSPDGSRATWASRCSSPTALRRGFPTPAALASLTVEDLPMPRTRARALIGLAGAMADGSVVLHGDSAGVRGALLALRIGPWTADYVTMRALGDRDAFPAGDLVLRRAARDLGLPDDDRGLRAHAERWHPSRAYAAHHLWAMRA